jgi:hypothetical protein
MFTLPRFALAPGALVAAAPVPAVACCQEVKRLKLGKTTEGILPATGVALEATGHLSSGNGVGARYSVGMARVDGR